MKKLIYSILLIACFNSYLGQHYWQQKIKYDMSIDFDILNINFQDYKKLHTIIIHQKIYLRLYAFIL